MSWNAKRIGFRKRFLDLYCREFDVKYYGRKKLERILYFTLSEFKYRHWYHNKNKWDRFWMTKRFHFERGSRKQFKNILNWLFNPWFSKYVDTPDCDDHFGYRDHSGFGLVLFGFSWMVSYSKGASWYTCECGYHPPEDTYIMVDDKTLQSDLLPEECQKWHKKGGLELVNIPEGKTVYPIYSDQQYTSNPSFSGYDWNEKHWCPYCEVEFEFNNSSY